MELLNKGVFEVLLIFILLSSFSSSYSSSRGGRDTPSSYNVFDSALLELKLTPLPPLNEPMTYPVCEFINYPFSLNFTSAIYLLRIVIMKNLY
jgi:hypothetical protein